MFLLSAYVHCGTMWTAHCTGNLLCTLVHCAGCTPCTLYLVPCTPWYTLVHCAPCTLCRFTCNLQKHPREREDDENLHITLVFRYISCLWLLWTFEGWSICGLRFVSHFCCISVGKDGHSVHKVAFTLYYLITMNMFANWIKLFVGHSQFTAFPILLRYCCIFRWRVPP